MTYARLHRVAGIILTASFVAAPALALADEPPIVNRIVDEGFNRSELPQTVAYLTDRIGARLVNSPQMRVAERWTQQTFKDWRLSNVHAEGFDFGRGWAIERAGVRMLTPRVRGMRSIPIAWTPSTQGAVQASIIVAPLDRERDFAKWQGQLRGRIVLISRPDTAADPVEPIFKRFSDEELRKADQFQQPLHSPAMYARMLKRAAFEAKRDAFLAAEGALLWVRKSTRDGGLVHGSTYGYSAHGFKIGETPQLPGVEIAAEDYRLLARLAKSGAAPTLEVLSDVSFHDDDPQAYNIIADLPGRDAPAGYVMAGAHLDSWAAADGAADNAAGCAIVMEAARILAKLGVKPRRSIRFVLWGAEEPGLLGSKAYVERHLAKRAALEDPALEQLNPYFSGSWMQRWPITPLPGYRQLGAYFNLDNGSGRIRGIHAEGNLAVVPIFKQWLQPFAAMGAATVAASGTGGTDHMFMQAVGIPGFQFIQDPLDYSSRTHHTDVDTYDHLNIADLKQAAVILATFLLNAADLEQPLPRMPLPTRPAVTDPFLYTDEEE